MRTILTIWACRWKAARLCAALFLVWVLGMDAAGRSARLALSQLPDFDYVSEVESLRAQGRYGEAIQLAEAGLADYEPQDAARAPLEAALAKTREEQAGLLRRAKDLGWGALSGKGDTLEAMIGAVAADFLIVGDVRDVLIEGGKAVTGEDADEVVLLLSAAGIATTLAPEVDWVPSLLKVARRAGALTESFAQHLKTILKSGKLEHTRGLFDDIGSLSKSLSPGGAMRAMRHADDPTDLARMARFVEQNPRGVVAIHLNGGATAKVLREATDVGDDVSVISRAARKGRAGLELLASKPGRAMLKPRPLLGLAKGVWKGNLEKLITRVLDGFDIAAWWLFPFAVAWSVAEVAWILRKLRHSRAETERRV